MKPLALLASRILLALSVTVVIASWVVCQWYCFGLLADAARVQLYVHADAGGWFFDLRRPDVVGPERGIRTYFESMERADRLPESDIFQIPQRHYLNGDG